MVKIQCKNKAFLHFQKMKGSFHLYSKYFFSGKKRMQSFIKPLVFSVTRCKKPPYFEVKIKQDIFIGGELGTSEVRWRS